MAFWFLLVVVAFAFAICKVLFMFIPSNVPSIDVDTSDVLDDLNQTKENSFIYIPSRRQTDKVQCYEPATMKYLGYFPALKPDEVKERVAQARKAQKVWAKSSFKQRRQFLRILLKYIIEHQELICEVSSRDTGKTMVDASLGEIMTTCEKITWLLSEGEKWLKPEYRSCGRSMLHKTAKVEFHPLGVIGAIVSWNYPFHNIFNPMLAAVFSGNSIVIKIMRNAADTLIPVTLELGGKDAFIVCDDVDVPHVAQVAVRGALQSSGQNCAGAERFYVQKGIYSSFVAEVVKIVKSVTAGPPLVGKYDMGAICMQEHSEKLQSLVNDALDKGAEIVGRGSVGNIGFWTNYANNGISTDEEAIKLANDSRYGLGCAVFSGSQKRAREIASQLHCGIAAINDFASNYMCQSLPFGGVKDSGFGRFAGVEGLRACCLVKSVVEDRWWPLIKTKLPKPIQYPISENAFEFQQSLVEALYGLNVTDRLRALVDVLKTLSEPNTSKNSKRTD
ncbi:UNVERIFIED_CONTAM: Aldehyde dehydrogenase 22A1 [Sesamum radiatum]|uniref:Aldehyde dehydrogenase 22A1 n=1 Tax=Sesamum radiatum TaxID=300843 RepID=A0AAW2UF12_SESRA